MPYIPTAIAEGCRLKNSWEFRIKELTGKTRKEMEKSKFFREFFPNAPYDSWYWSYSQKEISMDDSYRSVMHMLSPVKDAYGGTVYVVWVEELGYYWHKDPYGRERIDGLLEDVGDLDQDQAFHVMPYGDISAYTDRRPSVLDAREELVAIVYG